MKIIERLKYLFTAPEELDSLIQAEKDYRTRKHWEDNQNRLRLCYKHRQEPHYSHYSEDNCDYCKREKEIERFRAELQRHSDYKS